MARIRAPLWVVDGKVCYCRRIRFPLSLTAMLADWRDRFFLGSKERDAGIDCLRALAIILVMMRHFLDRNPRYDSDIPELLKRIGLFGWSGVDLFFVLSGFLIFSIIFRQEKGGTFDWLTFYAKRALRIWPAYFVSLLICMIVGQFHVTWRDLGYFVIFIQNYAGPLGSLNGGVYWSIAVEEHFYILAPLLLVAVAHFRKWRLQILIGIIVAPMMLRAMIYPILVRNDLGKFYREIYFPTHARMDTLAVGVMCAYLVAFHADAMRKLRWLFPLLAAGLLPFALLATGSIDAYRQEQSFAAGVFGFSLTALFWAAVLMTGQTLRIFDSFGKGFMQTVAYLSYSVYLYHIIVLNFLDNLFNRLPVRPAL
jgi:peptidoglycan/LPS O-acetylase OafA/YrhL